MSQNHHVPAEPALDAHGLVGRSYAAMNCWELVRYFLTCEGFLWPDTPEGAIARDGECFDSLPEGARLKKGDVVSFDGVDLDGEPHRGVAVMADAERLLFTGPGQSAKLVRLKVFRARVRVVRAVRPRREVIP